MQKHKMWFHTSIQEKLTDKKAVKPMSPKHMVTALGVDVRNKASRSGEGGRLPRGGETSPETLN